MSKHIKGISLFIVVIATLFGFFLGIGYIEDVIKPELVSKYGDETIEKCHTECLGLTFCWGGTEKKCEDVSKVENEYFYILAIYLVISLATIGLISYFIYRHEKSLLA